MAKEREIVCAPENIEVTPTHLKIKCPVTGDVWVIDRLNALVEVK